MTIIQPSFNPGGFLTKMFIEPCTLFPSLPPLCLRASLSLFSQYCFSHYLFIVHLFSANILIERTCFPTGHWYHKKTMDFCNEFWWQKRSGPAFLRWKDHSERERERERASWLRRQWILEELRSRSRVKDNFRLIYTSDHSCLFFLSLSKKEMNAFLRIP